VKSQSPLICQVQVSVSLQIGKVPPSTPKPRSTDAYLDGCALVRLLPEIECWWNIPQMFCPDCGAEYRPGFTHCTDCDVDLESELPKPGPDIDCTGLRHVWTGKDQDR
jgi:hypothetical protein